MHLVNKFVNLYKDVDYLIFDKEFETNLKTNLEDGYYYQPGSLCKRSKVR